MLQFAALHETATPKSCLELPEGGAVINLIIDNFIHIKVIIKYHISLVNTSGTFSLLYWFARRLAHQRVITLGVEGLVAQERIHWAAAAPETPG